MKIKHLFSVFFAAAAVLAGCEKPVDFGDPSLTISQYTAEVPMDGGSVTVKVNATRDWVVRTDADWVIVDPESGKASFDDVTVTITAPANTGVDRTADIEFYGGKLACESITLTQKGPGGDPGAAKSVTCAEFASMPDDDGTIYRLEGTISGSINTQYGNFDVVDASGSVYVYGCTNVDEYVDMLKKGNEIIVEGPKTTYNGKVEMKNATIISIEQGQGGGQEGGDHANSVYYNDFDKSDAGQTYGNNGNSWPYLDQFDGWKNQVGTGASSVSYDFNAMSARNNSNSDGSYSDYSGSGTNNLFFGSSAYFVIKDITLGSGTDYTLTFGTEKYAYGVDDNTFNHSEFHVYISNDGAKWVELAYAFPNGDKNGRWDQASSTFTLPAGTSKLSVYFASDIASSHRLDDVELVKASAAGTAIDFSKGVDLNGGGSGEGGGDGGDTPVVTPPTDITDATVAQFLAADESTSKYYRLTGEVSDIKSTVYGNFTITDATGSVYVYGLTKAFLAYDSENGKWPNDKSFADLGIKAGDTVTLVGTRGSYLETIEVCGAYCEKVVAGEGGDDTGGEATNEFSSGISWTLGTNAYDQDGTVNGSPVAHMLKLGTSKATGSATLSIPGGTTKIGFYAIGWNKTNPNVTVGGKTFQVAGNSGAAGNPSYTITVTSSDYYEVEVTEGEIEVTSDGRVIFFGINAK